MTDRSWWKDVSCLRVLLLARLWGGYAPVDVFLELCIQLRQLL